MQEQEKATRPTYIIVLGMAGSGKTRFVNKLLQKLKVQGYSTYSINLDPAVHQVLFPVNIDIRDSVSYSGVMQKYGLGPNGAILTCLNLFVTQFDQVLNIVNKRHSAEKIDYVVIDTPGQIEAFTWSACGQVVTTTLATEGPCILTYVIDTVRVKDPNSFMSNMLYALSVFFRSKLPIILLFNKIDIQSAQFALKWMADFETLDDALDNEQAYISDLSHTLALVLSNHYSVLNAGEISAISGAGFSELIQDKIPKAVKEFTEMRGTEFKSEGGSKQQFLVDVKSEKKVELKEVAEKLSSMSLQE